MSDGGSSQMTFRRILVAVDGSPTADHALHVGLELVRCLRAEVGVVHVVDVGRAGDPERGLLAAELLEDRRREGAALLDEVLSRTDLVSPVESFLREGRPPEEILAAARDWNADLIVVGSRGRSGLVRVVMGSVAETVVRHAPVPVLVVRRPKDADSAVAGDRPR
jgi:nucleotide-binding universal stress UspA family protein